MGLNKKTALLSRTAYGTKNADKIGHNDEIRRRF